MRLATMGALALASAIAAEMRPSAASEENDQAAAPPNAAVQYWNAIHEMTDHGAGAADWYHDRYLPTIKNGHRAMLDDTAAEAVQHLGPAMFFLHRGSGMEHCDWGLPFDEVGLAAPDGHIWSAQVLGRAACLRARSLFEQGRSGAAAGDLLAMLALGRHLAAGGRDGTKALLAGLTVERNAIETAARYLGRMGPDDRARLETAAVSLPGDCCLENLLARERQLWVDWHAEQARRALDGGEWDPEWLTGRLNFRFVEDEATRPIIELFQAGPKRLLAVADSAGAILDEAAKLIQSPDAPFESQWTELENEAEGNPLALAPLEQVRVFRSLVREAEVRRMMLRAAVAAARGGPEVLADFKAPYSGRPLIRRESDDGFELEATFDGRQVTLKVGRN